MEQKFSKTGNLLSDLLPESDGKVDFGGNLKSIGFDVDEWNRCYGENRPQSTKDLELYYLGICNAARKKNGLEPLKPYR